MAQDVNDRASMPRKIRQRGRLEALRRNERGAVLVEYSFVLVAVVLPTIAGISAGGVQMYNNYQDARAAILSASP